MAMMHLAVILLVSFVYANGLLMTPGRTRRWFSELSHQETICNDPRCTKNGIFADPTDCTSYISCNLGHSQVRKCPEGFQFDSRKHCTPEGEEADCGVIHFSPTKDGEKPVICPKPFGMFPDPNDPTSYMNCDEKIPIVRHCSPGMTFEQNVGCVDDHVSHASNQLCPENDSEPLLEAEELSEPTHPDVSEVVCSQNERHGYPSDCTRYVQCSNGQPRVMKCPEGLHYRWVTQECVPPCEALCEDHIPCALEGECENGQCFTCPETNGKFSDPFDCRIYYECVNSVPKIYSCWSGRYFDQSTSECTSRKMVKCLFHCEKPNGKYAFPHDCEKYIECFHKKPSVKRCPTGQSFDSKELMCLPKDQAHC